MNDLNITVHYKDGRVQHFPSASSSVISQAAVEDWLLRFDIASVEQNGIVLELRHHSPQVPADDDYSYQPDERGYECGACADTFVVLVTKDELANVSSITWKDKVIFAEVAGQLINVDHIAQLTKIYLDCDNDLGILSQIDLLYKVLSEEIEIAWKAEHKLDAKLKPLTDEKKLAEGAKRLGITPDILDTACKIIEASENKDNDGTVPLSPADPTDAETEFQQGNTEDNATEDLLENAVFQPIELEPEDESDNEAFDEDAGL